MPIAFLLLRPCAVLLGLCLLTGCGISGSGFTWPPRETKLPLVHEVIDRKHVSLEPTRPDGAGPPQSLATLDARNAVRLALQHSRVIRNLEDALMEQAFDTLAARRGFAWDADLVGAWETDDEGETSSNIRIDLRETFDTGGDILLRSNLDPSDGEAGATLRLEQPLLAGAGHTISHEAAIQEHRTLLYRLRTYETEREDTLLDVLDAYYDLINQEAVLENVRRNLEQSQFLFERSEAVFKVEKASYLDVLRAEQQLLTAENQLANAEADVLTAKKSFLALLGLDTELAFSIDPTPPPIRRLLAKEGDVLRAGILHNRELKTVANRIEDAERRLDLAENGLLPDIGVFAQTEAFSEDSNMREDNFSTGVNLSIPLQRGGLRDAVELAEIARQGAKRSEINADAQLRIQLLQRMNQLANFQRNVETQRQNVEIAEKRLEFALIRFEDGTLSNRDVVEAQTSELDARNALVRALVNHELERLRLLQSAGCLDVRADGRLEARAIPGLIWFAAPEFEAAAARDAGEVQP